MTNPSHTVEAALEPVALSAAYEAEKAHRADPGRKGSGLEKAILAYLLDARKPHQSKRRPNRMPIYFANAEPIDLKAIELMGVNVKPGTASPIGFFGTGLKYAIATLLRNHQSIRLRRDGKWLDFSTRPEIIRGETFQRVFMGETALGFPTSLGPTWEVWQAFRELESNCRDEGGTSGKAVGKLGEQMLETSDWGTLFVVSGPQFEYVWEHRSEIFLASQPIETNETVEIHERSRPASPMMELKGENPMQVIPYRHERGIYYRGVRAGEASFTPQFAYNFLEKATLTEDRTISNIWPLSFAAARVVAKSANRELVEKVLLAGEGSFEHHTFQSWPELGQVASEVVRKNLRNKNLNQEALTRWLTTGENDENQFEWVSPTPSQIQQLGEAFRLVRHLGPEINFSEVRIARGLGENIMGTIHRETIVIAERVFDIGPRYLASTIYEEWLHIHEHLRDESRTLQNWLLDKLFARVEEALNGPQAGEVISIMRPVRPDYQPDRQRKLTRTSLLAKDLDDDIPF